MLAEMSSHGTVLAAAAAALLGVGCSEAIDSDKAEATIARLVSERIGTPVAGVECPTGREAKKGARFTCQVTGKDGSGAKALVTGTDDDGGVRVTARFLPTDETERSLAAQLTYERRTPVAVDCQDIVVARKDVSFECTTRSGSRAGRVRARQLDDDGSLTYRRVRESS